MVQALKYLVSLSFKIEDFILENIQQLVVLYVYFTNAICYALQNYKWSLQDVYHVNCRKYCIQMEVVELAHLIALLSHSYYFSLVS